LIYTLNEYTFLLGCSMFIKKHLNPQQKKKKKKKIYIYIYIYIYKDSRDKAKKIWFCLLAQESPE